MKIDYTDHSFGQGKYSYFRDHDSANGWGIRLTGSDKTIASVTDKNFAALIADLLNKHGHEYDFLTDLEKIYDLKD